MADLNTTRAAVSSLSAGGATPSQAAQEGAANGAHMVTQQSPENAAFWHGVEWGRAGVALMVPSEWLEPGAVVPVTQDTVSTLLNVVRILSSAPPAAAAVEAVPGFKLVPVEPTDEMIYMMTRAIANRAERVDSYKAMLTAAPAAPVEAQPTYAHALLSALSKVRAVVPVAPDLEAEQRVSTLEFQFASWGEQTEAHVAWLNFRAALSEAQPVARVGSPSMGEGRQE